MYGEGLPRWFCLEGGMLLWSGKKRAPIKSATRGVSQPALGRGAAPVLAPNETNSIDINKFTRRTPSPRRARTSLLLVARRERDRVH